MDKKNTVVGILLLVAAFATLYLGSHLSPPPATKPAVTPPPAVTPAPATAANPATPAPATPATATPVAPAPATTPSDATFAAIAQEHAGSVVTTLVNNYIEVRLTDFGGAIKDVAFRQYPAELGQPEPYVFNQTHVDPILAFTEQTVPGLDRNVAFHLVSATPTEVVYQAVLDKKVEVTRRYFINAPEAAAEATEAKDRFYRADPYVIRHETTFRNLSTETVSLPQMALSLGTASLTSVNDFGQYLNVARYDGKTTTFTDAGALAGAGLIGRLLGHDTAPKAYVETPGPAVWAAVKNQFFACIYRAEQPGTSVITRRVDLPKFPGSTRENIGLTGAEHFTVPALAPGATTTLTGSLYVGPEEYRRLSRFPDNQDKVMQFDRYFFSRIFLSGYVAPLENLLMNWTHRWVFNWGLAIVLMTLILKTVSLPFTLAASRSAKRMQQFQPEIKALREKYKDNPQKLNQATLELFKAHKINPMGGCLPILITMPLFFGFFTMLQSSAELRFQGFLWARDLSAPDTVGHLFGFPVNIMPLLMGATMIFQMRLTPQPTVDNAQAKMMKFMPVLFTLFCYGYSCALAIYMTVNGLFTIGQQLVINRMKDPVTVAAPAKTPGGKPAPKNVTPAAKKRRK